MQDPAPYDPRRVTHHAVTRYVQRILGITVPGNYGGDNRAEAAAHCAAAGLVIDQVQALIWCPAIEAAARCGITQSVTPEFRAQISPSGIVVSVVARGNGAGKKMKPKLKILGKREAARSYQQKYRRWKG